MVKHKKHSFIRLRGLPLDAYTQELIESYPEEYLKSAKEQGFKVRGSYLYKKVVNLQLAHRYEIKIETNKKLVDFEFEYLNKKKALNFLKQFTHCISPIIILFEEIRRIAICTVYKLPQEARSHYREIIELELEEKQELIYI